ncbi:MAG: hypothetical protein KC646_09080 [Candidatus Cloacimonetes bacterium]|nr:hypothetical protein [Candidatus Cloacimonadota bacterium]
MNIKKDFPVFYVFKDDSNYWFYGNKSKSFRAFFDPFKSTIDSLDTTIEKQVELTNILLHQVLSFDGLSYDSQALSEWPKSTFIFNPFSKNYDISLHEFHKLFPYLLYKELFYKQAHSQLFSKQVLQQIVLKMIQDREYIVAENLIYFYFTLFGMDESYTIMTTMLSTVFASPQSSIAVLLTKDPSTASDAFLYQSYKAFEYQEKLFSSYGNAYKYELLIETLRKLYKRTKSMDIQNKIIEYSRRQSQSLEFVGCGCTD